MSSPAPTSSLPPLRYSDYWDQPVRSGAYGARPNACALKIQARNRSSNTRNSGVRSGSFEEVTGIVHSWESIPAERQFEVTKTCVRGEKPCKCKPSRNGPQGQRQVTKKKLEARVVEKRATSSVGSLERKVDRGVRPDKAPGLVKDYRHVSKIGVLVVRRGYRADLTRNNLDVSINLSTSAFLDTLSQLPVDELQYISDQFSRLDLSESLTLSKFRIPEKILLSNVSIWSFKASHHHWMIKP
ncbi:hypothetical protein BC938DRAFT_471446 [Jimgerdemannia flammicorona]|uniref:Uncharacterized protein n=1 Tax=Jimgerdemannia flammicorona TaxID=994334 RepID=A0A433QUL5_9FUNG|nr:hypothetical protein BC938DRAFT_471446 [Jimgerdemannia flammicorona]